MRAELLARSFYSWVQVRNVGAVDKVNNDRALYNYQRCIIRRVFRAWHFHLVSHTPLVDPLSTQPPPPHREELTCL